jgi:hypothetical protein
MARSNRTYKLKVSSAGFDLIVDSHARLVRETRTLLPYGTAVHAALCAMIGADPQARREAIRICPRILLGGGRCAATLFVGASRDMASATDALLAELSLELSPEERPRKTDLYLVALHMMLTVDRADLLAAYARVAVSSNAQGLR